MKRTIMKIDDILTEYKTNIQNFINLCKNKIVVFDFDGTLTKFKYASNRLLPCKQADIQKYAQSGKNLYLYKSVHYNPIS